MRIFHSEKELTPEERSLQFDFGIKLRFASYENLRDAFCTDFLCSEKAGGTNGKNRDRRR